MMNLKIDDAPKFPTTPPLTFNFWCAADWLEEVNLKVPNWKVFSVYLGSTAVCGMVRMDTPNEP